jgi:hypothetical protein
MLEQLKALFRKPTPLERAAKELGQIEHSLLDVDAEIMWAQKRKEYYILRKAVLAGYIQGETK